MSEEFETLEYIIEEVLPEAEDAGPFEDATSLLIACHDEDIKAEVLLARRFRDIAAEKTVEFAAQDTRVADRMTELIEEVLRLNAKEDFDSYLLFMEWHRDPKKRFYQPRRHVLFPLTQDMQDLADGKIDFLSISLPPRTGKLLAFDTPVLTREGWKKHGDLTIRDEVVAPNGDFVRVKMIHEPHEADYEVEFTNGEKIICHGAHEWWVYDRWSGREHVMETQEMIGKLESGGEAGSRGHRYMYQLPLRMPLIGEEKPLPVKPYTLGVWLGDGRNKNPDICGAESDYAVVQGVLDDGYELAWKTAHKTTGVYYYGFKNLRSELQSVGMCHSRHKSPKHIPDMYFTASLEQRLDLLAGLLDTDGCLSEKEHRYHFSTCDELLRDDFVKLVSTFGWRCCVKVEEPKVSTSGVIGRKNTYVIAFNPTFPIPCRLERKRLDEFSKQRRIAIKAIRHVSGQMGNCITVEGGLYCVGKTMIPTHNSTMGIFFMTWMMGRNPDTANVMSGHSDLLTKGFHQEALDIITDNATYRFLEVFPDSKLRNKSMADETINLGRRSRFPSLTCRSIEGTLTGAVEVGSDGILYMDDLVEDREEALNANRMDKLYSEYNNQLKDRMKDGARELSVATRWVPNDPIGRVQEEHEGDPRYRFVAIPALDENGESNFVYEYGLGFSTKYYEDMHESLVSSGEEDSWFAKYMQEPYYIGGLLFDKDELNYYDGELPPGEPDAVIAVCDTKDKGKDYACQPVGYVYGDRHYIHDVVCDNGLPEMVEPKLASCLVKNNVDMARYESNAAGGRVAEDIQEECRARGLPITIDTKFSTTNKETRILVDSQWVKENCYFRSDRPSTDYNKFLNMLTHYTLDGKNKNDDAPDAMSMYKRYAAGLRRAVVTPMQRPY